MPADTVYLLRHGDSRPDHIKRYIGQTDCPLNRTGREQAVYWRRALRGVLFERIYCSTLRRSHDTAALIADGQKPPVEALAELREINMGGWDGYPIDEIRRGNPEEYERRGGSLADHRPPGGENFNDLAARVLPLFEKVVKDATGPLLIVGHAGINRVILCHLLNLPRENLFIVKQDYGCLNIIARFTTGLWPRLFNRVPKL
jgi:broad specificity phosphatase PhoE